MKGGNMKTRYSGKSFKDSSTMKKAKLSLKEKRKKEEMIDFQNRRRRINEKK